MDSCEEDALKQAHTPTEDAQTAAKEKSKTASESPKLFRIFSRCGRTIKPKSPSTILVDSPKNAKMPKIKQETPPEDSFNDSLKVEDTSQASLMNESSNAVENSIKTEDEKVDHEDLQAKSPWQLGQLVWARMGKFPFWPGIIALKPTSKNFLLLKDKSNYVFVKTLIDTERCSWVSFGNVLPFLGLDDFEKKSKEITAEIRKKNPTFAAAFVIKPGSKLQWDTAVNEANSLMAKSIEERIKLFNPENVEKTLLETSLNNSIKTEDNLKKRKCSISTEEAALKKSKPQNGEIVDLEEHECKPTAANIINQCNLTTHGNAWVLQQLVWAKWNNMPLWPCQITLDPDRLQFFMRKGNNEYIHVARCDDSLTHAWVLTDSTSPFKGLEDFFNRYTGKSYIDKENWPNAGNSDRLKLIQNQWKDAVKKALDLLGENSNSKSVCANDFQTEFPAACSTLNYVLNNATRVFESCSNQDFKYDSEDSFILYSKAAKCLKSRLFHLNNLEMEINEGIYRSHNQCAEIKSFRYKLNIMIKKFEKCEQLKFFNEYCKELENQFEKKMERSKSFDAK